MNEQVTALVVKALSYYYRGNERTAKIKMRLAVARFHATLDKPL